MTKPKRAAPRTSLTAAAVAPARGLVARAHARLSKLRPGDRTDRQPVHTVYGGAHLFKPDTARKLGDLALKALETYAPDAASLARILDLPGDAGLHRAVYGRVVEKLRHEPVEDLRIDFEDGYGHRPDDEEDGHAQAAAVALARGDEAGTLPPFVGVRTKAFTPGSFPRASRTLDVFVTALVRESGGRLPGGFAVTLPKVRAQEEVTALCRLVGLLEKRHRLKQGAIAVELMVETPEALYGLSGAPSLPAWITAGGGRVRGAHYGTYDYTASLNVISTHQRMDHPACELALNLAQVLLAGTGVTLSDGATTELPVPPHRPVEGQVLSFAEQEQNREVVSAAWRLAYRNIWRALVQGIYQGWDLHPAQLPVRYAAVYAFFLSGLPEASARLGTFLERAARATLTAGTFDDAATGQGLLNFFLRGIACGALTEQDASAAGLTVEELRTRSFAAILQGRTKASRTRAS